MSVLKSKRKASQFEVFHHYYKLRREITGLLLRDFGFSKEKSGKRMQDKEAPTEYDKRVMERNSAFEEWFIMDERTVVIDCLRKIGTELFLANSIYPTCQEELTQRRLRQDYAIGQCYRLVQELQYAMETLPVDVNKYLRFGEMIQNEINLIKGWRKSDNKFQRAFSDTPPTSAM